MKKILLLAALGFAGISAYQVTGTDPEKAPKNWFNLSYEKDGIHGVGTERTYEELLKNRKPADTVIVAVIDGGVDYMHEDLKNVMWHNPKEIAGNKLDDDKNGYVDDIYGWNFIGGKDGRNVQYDQLEMVRLYKPLKEKYEGKDPKTVTDKKEYATYTQLKTAYEKAYNSSKSNLDLYTRVQNKMIGMIKEVKNKKEADSVMYKHLADYTPSENYKGIYLIVMSNCKTQEDWAGFQKDINEGVTQLGESVDYNLNLDYDPRNIVGDNYNDSSEKFYGNPDIKGPDALHGTHVAGIIAAQRDNDLGIKGVAAAVKIMGIRVVPNGDERDKDVANGIRYAVDNGADIINMSFGKSYSYDKGVVDEAVKYAESKGVLLVHAAGNDSKNNDKTNNFPRNEYQAGGASAGWIEVGALNWRMQPKLTASFSNYGQKEVDVFAPGVDLNAPLSNGGYIDLSGTSMASPVVAGVCAVLKSYFPSLTPAQMREIIMTSSDKSLAKAKTIRPGEKKKKMKFGKMSVTGGMVDLYAAFKLAETKAGK
jgi:subtilisin family serine protease